MIIGKASMIMSNHKIHFSKTDPTNIQIGPLVDYRKGKNHSCYSDGFISEKVSFVLN